MNAHPNPARTSILVEGRNCWTCSAPIDACGLLIDGEEYYRAFYRAAKKARRYLFIAGWKFNSDIRLLRGPQSKDLQEDTRLLPFLQQLLRENPELEIRILAWDFSVIYSWEWESNLQSKFSDPEGRLQFGFDSFHPVGASHHQKFVVVDGRIAFVGGFDFNGDDWDDRHHRPNHPDRDDCGKHHGPYHDVQACLVGRAAEELARYFQSRWHASGKGPLRLSTPESWDFDDVGLPLAADRVALSENRPATFTGNGSILQIRQLYVDSILSARALIYIENQYFTSEVIAEALSRRMRNRRLPPLNIAVVQPKQLPGWVEAATLEPLRLNVLNSLAQTAAESGHRLGFYYTAAPRDETSEVATLIHSKLMIVDDRFLTVGSANLSNRSQGLDTELNVSWETPTQESELASSIQRLRVELLAEHCGGRADPALRTGLMRSEGLVDYLNEQAESPARRLRRLSREIVLEDRTWLAHLEQLGFSLDPANPIFEELL